MLNTRVEVLHVIGAFCSGGAEWFVINLLRTLKEKGISVGLLALSSRHDEVSMLMRQLLDNAGVPYEFGPTEKVRFRSTYWYTKKIKEINPDIIHCHTPNTELIHYLANKLSPNSCLIFRTLHSTFLTDKRLYLNALWKNQAEVSIACSDSVKSACQAFVQGEVITIKNGVKFDWPIQTKFIQEQMQIHLGLQKDIFHFICVGRLDGKSPEVAAKGHDVLIKAWKLAEMGNKKCLLHILGDGNLRNELEKLAFDDESIIFHGIRKDVHDWLIAADCYVMPSRYEGLPVAGIEALGTGLPSLFSEIPPLQEIGVSAVLWSKVDDEKQLAENMNHIRSNKLELSLSGVKKIRQNFGIERTSDRYIELYHKAFRQSA